ncbi:electron transfer flavoprotein subunit alpha/FixB family protein [Fulvimarina endophytica]|uniref:Electron transfer flavoprotein subunit alpha/FixB family protein n=1 Tax=Fulvimarina endophytica TaxID=2293836 RepID=A0A371X7J9_9HYPH|nr:electron transfer flavoprotein subunit alpha/FixB family protein [Fulvimarina endophytica]RFC65177.1 electron transfer flavoprotein subunit alpha/FixB family protein [Fulvimarina endophytica]
MSRTRRDPRNEREAKSVASNTRRRFDLGLVASTSRRPRRDPRAEFASAEVEGRSRRRFDRTQTTAAIARPIAEAPHRRQEEVKPATRIVETPAFLVFAVLEAPKNRLSRFDRQVLGAARMLADAKDGGGAVVALAPAGLEEVGAAGADRILPFADDLALDDASRAAQLRAAMESLEPRHVLFAEDGRSADLARRLAASTGESFLADVVYLTAKQAARRKIGMTAEEFGAPPRLVSIGEDRVAAYAGAPCEARPIEDETHASPAAGSAIVSVETIPGDPASLSLSETDFVVSAGNGVSDFEAFKALAAELSGTPGASRVVCDAGLMPRGAQVGASGTVLAADCYLALGIAGAPQHLQGVAACEHVIAVNTDLHAAMVERAGLAIIQDAQRVMPALRELLEERRNAS